MPTRSNLANFLFPLACGQTELPDRSVLIGQNWVENAKIEKFKCDILDDFQILCSGFDKSCVILAFYKEKWRSMDGMTLNKLPLSLIHVMKMTASKHWGAFIFSPSLYA